MSTQDVFFSDNNVSILYNLVNRNVLKKTQTNLNTNRKYQKIFSKLCHVVYKEIPDKTNLQVLNTTVINKTIPYFIDLINKSNISPHTKNRHTNNAINQLEQRDSTQFIQSRPTYSNIQKPPTDQSVMDRFNQLSNDRQETKPQNNTDMFADNNNNQDQHLNTNKVYGEILNERRGLPKNIATHSNNELNLLSYQNADLSGLSMSELDSDLSSNIDPNSNPLELYNSQSSQRKNDETEYKNYFDDQKSFQNKVEQAEKIESDILSKRNQQTKVLDNEFNKSRKNKMVIPPDNRVFYKSEFKDTKPNFKLEIPTYENTMTKDITVENPHYEEYKNQLFEKKQYIQKSHMISINSRNRKWKDNRESRYNYSIQFSPTDDTSDGLSISTLYKNITSIELVRTVLAHDNTPLPFDNRLYMGIQSYPYLVLNLKEIDGIYSGTNDHIDKCFAHLIFDKEYKCEILSSGQIGTEMSPIGTNSTPSTAVKVFDKQYSRGFCGYIPVGFEKKIFYPSPLASLNKLTIQLTTPDGENISNLRDNLDITAVALENVSNLQLKKPTGFPKENSRNIKLTTKQFFTNRTFRIGDKIIIDDYTIDTPDSSQSEFIDFINRQTGHYIINLTLEVSTNDDSNTNDNEGFINTIYISPPGNYDDSTGGIKDKIAGIADGSLTVTQSASTTPRLLNLYLQNHYIFKIITRDFDTNSVMNIVNT